MENIKKRNPNKARGNFEEILIKLPQAFIRLFGSRRGRCHRRRVFFECAFKELLEPHGFFSGVNGESYYSVCRELAGQCDFYFIDRRYRINIGDYFSKYSNQSFETLYVELRRNTWLLMVLFIHKYDYTVNVYAKENGQDIRYSYDFTYTGKETF